MTDTTTRPEQGTDELLASLSDSGNARSAAALQVLARLLQGSAKDTGENHVRVVAKDEAEFLELAAHYDCPQPERAVRHRDRIAAVRHFGGRVHLAVEVSVDRLRGRDVDAEVDEWCRTLQPKVDRARAGGAR